MKIHHIGIIVENIEEEAELYIKLGYSLCGEIVNDTVQFNRILFLRNNGEIIELIEPLDERSSVINLDCGYAHICYEVDNLDSFINDFKTKRIGVVFTDKIMAPAIENRAVAFAYLKNRTIVEFLEKA